MSVPAWIVPAAYVVLQPQPDVMKLGDVRSAENLLKASQALHVREAPRYQPIKQTLTEPGKTWCNIFLADVCQILKAPLPHLLDPDADGPAPAREERANMIVDDLAAGRFPGWSKIEAGATDAANRAQIGLPTIAVWKNPNGTGHVALVVPAPAGKHGVYITQAGGQNLEQLPLVCGFGAHDIHCQFYGHN